ncbi:MAG: hypothetical protein V3V08_15445 [Nannocystaceae bacterium]
MGGSVTAIDPTVDPWEAGCVVNSDCTAAKFGQGIGIVASDVFCGCVYGCQRDADCGANEVYVCAGVGHTHSQCIPSACTTGEDCPDERCELSVEEMVCDSPRLLLACRPEIDECGTDEDCVDECESCLLDDDLSKWACREEGPKCADCRAITPGVQ